ncbi:alpha/beta-hydrolase [Dacryopinax primogenitus]|uniref:Carboxylic ester hydrolase n=1 Tax=Dacryopinax primogenitus (strain DJM 731) TaxID=1858805 RepID=M5FU52_DACPD|nr:alpha/beta-hydrolase [Dacryopinax primogenitus]EJT99693.1 alpha/beta-hydrolase [Dacryopinax primogenitus]
MRAILLVTVSAALQVSKKAMFSMFVIVTAILSAPILVAAAAAPTVASLNSSLTFIFQNNLNYSDYINHQGAILIDAGTFAQASSTCSSLSESVIAPISSYFVSDFTASLAYLEYASLATFGERFWISQSNGACRTIGIDGSVSATNCSASHRALCSQSAGFSASPSSSNHITVRSNGLTLTGYRNQVSFRFLGIPYANQPTRFTYSPIYTGTSTINATAFGSPCLQLGRGSEDCLFLNIWTPYIPASTNPPASSLKAVHFFIHGGGYISGAGSDLDGGVQSSRGDVVVVGINYRLGTLGFLALEDGVTNGNFALADMVTALEWVQKHITAFGGDPNRITITGQSAGAGAPGSNLDGLDYAATYSNYYTIAQEMAVSYSASSLILMTDVASFLVVDGKYITSSQLPVSGSGPVANVNLMMGIVSDDGNSFIQFTNTTDLATAITEEITNNSTWTNEIINSGLFPQPNTGNTALDVFNVTARISTDVQFRCLDQATVVALSKHHLMKSIWFYQLNRGYNGYDPNGVCSAPAAAGYPYGNPELPHFNCHSGEMYWVFGYVGQPGTPFRDENDYIFEQTIVDQWTSFFRTYNPNRAIGYLTARDYTTTAQQLSQNGQWQALTNYQSPTLRILAQPNYQSAFLAQPQCDFFNYPLSYYG